MICKYIDFFLRIVMAPGIENDENGRLDIT